MNTTDPTPRESRKAGTLTLAVWPESPVGAHQRYAYRVEDATTGHSLEGRDLFTGAGDPVAPCCAAWMRNGGSPATTAWPTCSSSTS